MCMFAGCQSFAQVARGCSAHLSPEACLRHTPACADAMNVKCIGWEQSALHRTGKKRQRRSKEQATVGRALATVALASLSLAMSSGCTHMKQLSCQLVSGTLQH